MKNILLYSLYIIFSFTVKTLPDKLRYYLGKGFGKLAYILTKSRRQVAKDNLRQAFNDQLSELEISRTIKNVYSNMGLTLVEFVLIEKINSDNFQDYFEIEGKERLVEAYEQGNGVIIYGAHFGNWEWMGMIISLLGYPLSAIVRTQKNSYFDQAVNQIRMSKGVKIIPKGASVRKVFHSLKKGECIFILGDQDAHGNGWELDFFGRSVSTHAGPVQFAQRTGATIVPVFLIREEWGQHRLLIKETFKVKKNTTRKEQKKILQNLNDLTESVIREHKDQWLWLHKRWKTYSKTTDNNYKENNQTLNG